MNFKVITKVCSQMRPFWKNINLRRTRAEEVILEATDGCIGIQITYPLNADPETLVALESGRYTPKIWIGPVCRRRQASPVQNSVTLPDLDLVVSNPTEGSVDCRFFTVITAIIGREEEGVRLLFCGEGRPLQIDYQGPDGKTFMAATIPMRSP